MNIFIENIHFLQRRNQHLPDQNWQVGFQSSFSGRTLYREIFLFSTGDVCVKYSSIQVYLKFAIFFLRPDNFGRLGVDFCVAESEYIQ